jgi:beta-glucosidase
VSELNEDVEVLLSALTLEEKVSILTGSDFWNTQPNKTINLRKLLLSDGPAGVRGEYWDERDNSLNLPSGTALGSTWDPEFARRIGNILAREAERKGVDVVLGPTINLHRTPLGGRHFECLSEDPYLTGSIAVGLIDGVQSQGKGSCPKHFVCNDSETDRLLVNVKIDERTLREVYMRPFEDAIIQGKAWAIMSAYNSVNGTTMTESALLESPLRSEWGFDGVVISDWTAVRTIESANAEQDLVMPGPVGPWGDALIAEVRSGSISEETINRKVRRIILLATRLGAIGKNTTLENLQELRNEIPNEDVEFSRQAAIEGSVLLKNNALLPLNFDEIKSVALIGHNARLARSQGGGSATVLPKKVVSPLIALKELLGERLQYGIGAIVQEGIIPFEISSIFNKFSNTPGIQISMFDSDGALIHKEDRFTTNLIWLDSHAPLPEAHRMRISCTYRPDESGEQLLGFASVHPVTMSVNGEEFLKAALKPTSEDPFSALMAPAFISRYYNFEFGEEVELELDIDLSKRSGVDLHAMSFKFGLQADKSLDDQTIQEAVALAQSSDIAIVVVGTNEDVESEGGDRRSISLPGRQDELVEAISAVNNKTIVIVNSGSPVELPWANKVSAILLTYFSGQEMGNALVDILAGSSEPGGRLPTTWARSQKDIPVLNCTPRYPEIQLTYEEGIHIGYRAWLKSGKEPLFPFGAGLGYTTWEISDLVVKTSDSGDLSVEVKVTNTGERRGKYVLQVYASRSDSSVDRPIRWLVGYAAIRANSGEENFVQISVRKREFQHWDSGWSLEAGKFTVHVGSNVQDLPLHTTIELT